MKGNSYSLHDMLQDANTANYFVGGTVYQAFLRAQDYHRLIVGGPRLMEVWIKYG